jgi:predicted NAD-dependent protein-ADP-ribosyltransferase YbiA (DUF1768 family)
MATDRLFFHSGSADRAPGVGRHESVVDPSAYAALAQIPNWRKMLSNFWVADFVYEGLTYRTVEHCFQAAKIAIANPGLARDFALESQSSLSQGDGLAARKQRKLVLLAPQQLALWDRCKHVVMQSAMRAKFTQNPALMAVLQTTRDAQLWHGTGRGSRPQRIYDLEAVRSEARDDRPLEADIVFRFEGRAVAGLVLDPVQNGFPWYEGSLIEGPAYAHLQAFLAHYRAADIERDFAAYHPDEGPYEETDLFAYAQVIATHREHRSPLTDDEHVFAWLAPWRDAADTELDRYLEFLDWRRWQAVGRSGAIERGIALPPSLDFATKRYAYRPR